VRVLTRLRLPIFALLLATAALTSGSILQAAAAPRALDKEAQVAAFLARQRTEAVPLYRVLDVRSVPQQCGNYCGPATILEALAYSGVQTSQTQLAQLAGTPGCGINAIGTCISAIRTVLNQRYQNLPEPGWFRSAPLRNAEEYWGMTGVAVAEHGVPVGNLLNPNPADGSPYCLPTWCNTTASSVHFVLTSGVSGTYDGSDRAASVYYVDSATGQHLGDAAGMNGWWTSVNGMANVIAANNGYGGCDGINAIVW